MLTIQQSLEILLRLYNFLSPETIAPGTPVAIYTRSTHRDEQGDNSTLRRQRLACEQFAASHKWSVTRIYEDNGYSGNNWDRPGWTQMLSDVPNGNFQVLLVYNLNRIVRRVVLLPDVLALLDTRGITVVSVSDFPHLLSKWRSPNITTTNQKS